MLLIRGANCMLCYRVYKYWSLTLKLSLFNVRKSHENRNIAI